MNCICGGEHCHVPITAPLPTYATMRVAQAWADLRVVLAKSYPDHDPSTTEQYFDLQDAIRAALTEIAPNATATSVVTVAADSMHLAHQMTLHELLYCVSQGQKALCHERAL